MTYNMNNPKRGIGLVINIRNYANNAHKEREWSAKDVERLEETLKYLEFDFKLENNLTKQQIEQSIDEQVKLTQVHVSSDCFLCVIMSHGNEDYIVASDNEYISFEEIMSPIKSCKYLFNKPKIFLFQACRGDNKMERAGSASSRESSNELMSDDIEMKKNLKPSHVKKIKTIFEEEADLCVFFSTLPNHLSFSNDVAEGTIFINSFCDVFNKAYKNIPNNLSLAQMIVQINERVMKQKLQIPVSNNQMKGEIYFLPKNVNFKMFFLHNF